MLLEFLRAESASELERGDRIVRAPEVEYESGSQHEQHAIVRRPAPVHEVVHESQLESSQEVIGRSRAEGAQRAIAGGHAH